jgi:hypothetical protein
VTTHLSDGHGTADFKVDNRAWWLVEAIAVDNGEASSFVVRAATKEMAVAKATVTLRKPSQYKLFTSLFTGRVIL